jgi:hypothetical protein
MLCHQLIQNNATVTKPQISNLMTTIIVKNTNLGSKLTIMMQFAADRLIFGIKTVILSSNFRPLRDFHQ